MSNKQASKQTKEEKESSYDPEKEKRRGKKHHFCDSVFS